MHGLTGRRVLVTRSADRAAGMIGLLAQRGASAILLPAMRQQPVADLTPLRAALARHGDGDWVVFTSATAVDVVFDALDRWGVALPSGVRLGAVGRATASAIAGRGHVVDAVPDEHRGDAVSRAIGASLGTRVLLPRADIARPETVAALRADGAQVEDVVVYHTVLAAPEASSADVIRGVDVITFTSPSTVEGLVRRSHGDLRRIASHAVIGSIGPTTSAAVRACGMSVHVEPREHTVAALVQELDDWFSMQPTPAA